ncbi:hypothetical protein L3X38_023813 [Prunus dulcis]|uniref:FAR1 domain-containing protein n=1 Tax=Prunus dulcis TaxID=3755 RepID=A0AAD4Z5N8_PRUDU|nr:hypothetical protein L3X38_023813 [Prunus dulcis]
MKKRSLKKGDCGELKYVTLSCSRSGIPQSTTSNVLNPYPSIKCNCKAQLRVGICLDGSWKVNLVKLDHNHGLNLDNARYFRMNRAISSYMKRKIEANDRARIRVNKNYNSMVVKARGHENMPFMENDCRNYINKVRKLQLGEGDVTARCASQEHNKEYILRKTMKTPIHNKEMQITKARQIETIEQTRMEI